MSSTTAAERDVVRKLARGSLFSRLVGHGRQPLKLAAVPRDHVAGDRSRGDALLAGRFTVGSEIAQPREALQLLGERTVGADRGEIGGGQRQRLRAEAEAAGEQGVAAGAIAGDMVARDRGQLERLAAVTDQAREQRAASKLADDIALGRAGAAHPSPRKARMLAA